MTGAACPGLPGASVSGGSLAGAVWAGAALAGAFCAQAGNAGRRTREAAANNDHEGSKQIFGFIIQGIPRLLSRPDGKIPFRKAERQPRQPLGAALPTVKTILTVIGRKSAPDYWIFVPRFRNGCENKERLLKCESGRSRFWHTRQPTVFAQQFQLPMQNLSLPFQPLKLALAGMIPARHAARNRWLHCADTRLRPRDRH